MGVIPVCLQELSTDPGTVPRLLSNEDSVDSIPITVNYNTVNDRRPRLY